MVICSNFWGNLEGIWGIPGEILHIGWKIPGVYRIKIIHTFMLVLNGHIFNHNPEGMGQSVGHIPPPSPPPKKKKTHTYYIFGGTCTMRVLYLSYRMPNVNIWIIQNSKDFTRKNRL